MAGYGEKIVNALTMQPVYGEIRPVIEGCLPLADAAGVDVDEVGLLVVADAASLHAEGGLAQIAQRDVMQPDVDRLGIHVQAALGDAAAAGRGQQGVGLGRAVSGDDLESLAAAS